MITISNAMVLKQLIYVNRTVQNDIYSRIGLRQVKVELYKIYGDAADGSVNVAVVHIAFNSTDKEIR